jgi:hypothetical protein
MLCLPPLCSDAFVWHLPLADSTALLLSRLVLEESYGEETTAWSSTLAIDPAITLWSVCTAQQVDAVRLDTISAVAAWIASRLYEVWEPVSEKLENELDRSTEVETWIELTMASVPASTEEWSKDYLYRLLSVSDSWLSACGPVVTWKNIRAGQTCVPSWLADHREPHPEPDQEQRSQHSSALVNHIQGHWQRRLPDAGYVLDALNLKLRRFHRLEQSFEVTVEEAKLKALKQFAYGAGHEINNPLANISTRAQTLLIDESDPERRRKLATINSQAFRAHEMIADLMLFAQPPKIVSSQVDLGDIVDQVILELVSEAKSRDIELVRRDAGQEVLVMIDRDQLNVALRSLCMNSLEAIGKEGKIELSVALAERALCQQPTAEIVVSDTGPGIPEGVRCHLFDPFFSGREAGRGLGFGLPKSWRIITDHGGTIVVDSQPNSGATFTVTLPVRPG